MQTKQKSLIFGMLIVIILFSASFNLPIRGSSFVHSEDYFRYTVISSSNTINFFYGTWPPGNFFGNWSVKPGDTVLFTVSIVNETTIQGNITIGNSSFINVRNIDIANALIISIYPWLGGLIVNEDWSEIETKIADTNTTSTTINHYPFIINGMQKSFSVIIFNTTNYYGQYSTLIYDYETGLLLSVDTSFGNYHLALNLSDTSITIGEDKTFKTTLFSTLTIIGVLLLTVIKKSFYGKRKRGL